MSETPQIDPNTTNALTAALRPWVQQAPAYIKQRPDLTAELAKCMDGDRDVRIVFHTRGKAITVEACDYAAGTVAELFRQHLIPDDGGFALPDTPTAQ